MGKANSPDSLACRNPIFRVREASKCNLLQFRTIMSAEPEFKEISRRKQAELDSRIPQGWRLQAQWVPPGMLSPEESITNTRQYESVNVMDIPGQCGLLSTKQIEITEKWDVKGLLAELAAARLSAGDVCEAFCKVRGRQACFELCAQTSSITVRFCVTYYHSCYTACSN